MEKGNVVHFRTKDENRFILNEASEDKILLKPNDKGSYLMKVSFEGSRDKTWITVDNGAEENLCLWDWGRQFGIREPPKWMSFRNASGGSIEHYGMRVVKVESTF